MSYDVVLNETAALHGLGLYDPSINYESGSGSAPWWADLIQQGISTTPAIIAAGKGAQGQGIPTYPGGGPAGTAYNYPPTYYAQSDIGGRGALGVNPYGVGGTGSFNVSSNMVVIGGLALVVLVLMMSKKR